MRSIDKIVILLVRFLAFCVNIVRVLVTIIFSYFYQFYNQFITNIPQLVLTQQTPLTFKKNIEDFFFFLMVVLAIFGGGGELYHPLIVLALLRMCAAGVHVIKLENNPFYKRCSTNKY